MRDLKKLAGQIMDLTSAEKDELASILRVEYGVEASRVPHRFIPEDVEPSAVAVSAVSTIRPARPEPQVPSSRFPYEIWMNGYDRGKKLNAVKAVKINCKMTLMEAKVAVESSENKLTLLGACSSREEALAIVVNLETGGCHAHHKMRKTEKW